MELKDILAKIASGDGFTDEEKAFAGGFDLQKLLDSTASGARKKAEEAKRKSDEALAALQAEFDEFKASNDPNKGRGEVEKLLKRVERLEADKKAAELKAATMERTAKVRELAKKAGITAAKGVDPATIDLLVDHLMADVDLEDEGAVKTAFDSFKGSNAGLIAAETVGGVGVRGNPGAGAHSGANPFSKKSFNLTEQLKLKITNPKKAEELEASAANE